MATGLLLLLLLPLTTVMAKTVNGTSRPMIKNRGALVLQRNRDCHDVLMLDHKKSDGVYTIYVGRKHGPLTPVKVYCDMTTDGGGWTVLMRRKDGSVWFYRPWNVYKEGFGDIKEEFWLGNENIHLLTSNIRQKLRVDVKDFGGNSAYAEYDNFHVGTEEEQYKLVTIGTYSGTAGDSLRWQLGYKFSTLDQDTTDKCACNMVGAWWYHTRSCAYAGLTGLYVFGKNNAGWKCLLWYHWKKAVYSLKFAEMKIRPFHL